MSEPRLEGVYGGTFNPIHMGHLRSAQELFDRLPLAHLRFVPAKLPPHRDEPAVSAEHRAAMVEAAIAGDPRLSCDRRELAREGPSYTVDTLISLRRELGAEQPLALVMGCDAFLGLDSWYRWHDLVELAHIVVMARPGQALPETGAPAMLLRDRKIEAAGLIETPWGSVCTLELTPWPISSTEIRALLQSGQRAGALVPAAAERYLRARGLYAADRPD
ncbi:MAG: nicotinate-nucleotide adenylyltransferase [Pseudomonadota bacterium]